MATNGGLKRGNAANVSYVSIVDAIYGSDNRFDRKRSCPYDEITICVKTRRHFDPPLPQNYKGKQLSIH
ncbi:uncharacterized protein PHALS_14935 [Plasmopara halstedii]|uniref:Uncharacterized protein n=1 Tax=Plasmopara halstedii TaxID=4781 RepID=A0A0P1AWK2_PLAHL|nr:uncharacterized protein PHALS_14935 [Plasmopara halstedii]CEG46800.1 hypothetical protein PHALS_14935 [Plasmopara halstedii]|eukprot:XP_024583169.1 hypothetical protein PHALS_14935 [Plasmopara halstedii]